MTTIEQQTKPVGTIRVFSDSQQVIGTFRWKRCDKVVNGTCSIKGTTDFEKCYGCDKYFGAQVLR